MQNPDRARTTSIFPVGTSVDDQLSDREFQLFQKLVQKHSGIFLEDGKKAFLVRRLGRRLKAIGVNSFSQYYRAIASSEGETELNMALDAVTTNETSFFRGARQFEYIQSTILPALVSASSTLRKPRDIRIWSASCSTGEEPYTIAMVMTEALPSNWLIRVLATDLSISVLQHARAARYNIKKLSEIPEEYHKPCLLRGRDENEGLFCIAPEIRTLVDFKAINLTRNPLEITGTFDMIFCRNTLMYFDESTTNSVVDQLVQRLRPGGFLFFGQAESLAGKHESLAPASTAIFQRRGALPSGRSLGQIQTSLRKKTHTA